MNEQMSEQQCKVCGGLNIKLGTCGYCLRSAVKKKKNKNIYYGLRGKKPFISELIESKI